MICALLIGRKGSVGFPGKNLKPILGHPLAWYPMQAALSCSLVDNVFISTDDAQLMALAEELGVQIIKRPDYLCSKNSLAEEAFKHGCEVICQQVSETPELILLLFCNAPTITVDQIETGIHVLRNHPEYDSAVTVSEYNMWSPLRARKIGADGLLHPFVPFEAFGDPSKMNCDRDSQGDVWFADGSLSVIRPVNFATLDTGLLPFRWMGQKIYPIKNALGLDIDYEWQLGQIEFWLKSHGFDES